MNVFSSKNILVTGHTGFKGSWLSLWLSRMGARVYGWSDKVPTIPSHFELTKDHLADDVRGDVGDGPAFSNYLDSVAPDFVFHLAAQPIVFKSFECPASTFMTNCMGTVHVLDSLRRMSKPCVAVMITSDKCYDNDERSGPYAENDRLGGKDPYSGSKGAAELAIRSYVQSFFKDQNSLVGLGVGRAGNVIGGGDWADYRVVPDCVRAWSKGDSPKIRNPRSTRPWQHVLEPLSGYLVLASRLQLHQVACGSCFNFGPPESEERTVAELIDEMIFSWKDKSWINEGHGGGKLPEANLLKLNCSKAHNELGWQRTLNFSETAKWTSEWYQTYYDKGVASAYEKTIEQIEEFEKLALSRETFAI